MGKKRRAKKKSKAIPLPLTLFAARPIMEALLGSPGKYAGAFNNFKESKDMGSAFKEFTNVLAIEFAGTDMNNPAFQPFNLMDRAIGTWASIAIGLGIHKFLGKSINPYFRRIPVIGKYIGV